MTGDTRHSKSNLLLACALKDEMHSMYKTKALTMKQSSTKESILFSEQLLSCIQSQDSENWHRQKRGFDVIVTQSPLIHKRGYTKGAGRGEAGGGGRGCPSTMKKRRQKHTYNLVFEKNEKRTWKTCYPNAVKFRQKPFLQAYGVPACALLCAL